MYGLGLYLGLLMFMHVKLYVVEEL
jgi:hypothetical protein